MDEQSILINHEWIVDGGAHRKLGRVGPFTKAAPPFVQRP